MNGPVRTCIGCRKRFPLADGRLVRIVAVRGGIVAMGPTLAGRGAWVCGSDQSCFDRACKRKVLSRALRVELTPDAAARLHDQLQANFQTKSPDARD